MKIQICVGSKCLLMGAMTIYDQVEDLINSINHNEELHFIEEIEIEPVKCLEYCLQDEKNISPIVVIDDEIIFNATGQSIMERIYQLAE